MSEPTKVFTAHIPLSLADRIDQMAEQLEHTRAWVIKQALANWIAEEEAREVTPCTQALIEAAAALPQPCVPHDHAAFEPVRDAEEQVRAWFDYFCCTDPPPRTGSNTLN